VLSAFGAPTGRKAGEWIQTENRSVLRQLGAVGR
jgi:hypothetical protein